MKTQYIIDLGRKNMVRNLRMRTPLYALKVLEVGRCKKREKTAVTHTHTVTHRCACAPRVKRKTTENRGIAVMTKEPRPQWETQITAKPLRNGYTTQPAARTTYFREREFSSTSVRPSE